MHNLLESYLAEVAAHLSPLPPKQRAEELREMRAHLENAVIVNRELGQAGDEAVRAAVAQFGKPEDLGENVVWAWRRGKRTGRRKDAWSFSGAAACVMALVSLEVTLLRTPENSFLHSPDNTVHPWFVGLGVLSVAMIAQALAGWIGGFAFPRRAVLGATFAVALPCGIGVWLTISKSIQYGRPDDFYAAAYRLLSNLVFGAITVLGAWAGSRWRAKNRRGGEGVSVRLKR